MKKIGIGKGGGITPRSWTANKTPRRTPREAADPKPEPRHTHYLHTVVGCTEIRKGEGMLLGQLIQDTSYNRETNVRLQPFDLDILTDAFDLRETTPVELPENEKGVPTIFGKSKGEAKDKDKEKEKKHKKRKDREKDKNKENKELKHRHKDKDKETKKDRSWHHDSLKKAP
ncbi:60S ribosomal protein L5 [Gossypium australe]|uniref:60S ribosomal protein L5 n=1 Tax=Gossypium australe TaxID=47621 RepID=A0A5B6VQF4_9ROSI|nr:60S ribosomal protein L5 [Gossypium australe]